MVCRMPGAGGKAMVLLGNPETWRITLMQGDYYWLKVTSCPPQPSPHEADDCRECGGCCVDLNPGNPPLRRNKGLIEKQARLLNTQDGKEGGMLCKYRDGCMSLVLKIVLEFKTLIVK